MIAVPVSDDEVINLGDAGVFGGGHDALRVADCACPRVSGVDEHRLTRGRHEEHDVSLRTDVGTSALDIYDIHVQGCSRRPRLRARKRGTKNEGQKKRHCFAHKALLGVVQLLDW